MSDTTTAGFSMGRAFNAAIALIARKPARILLFAVIFGGLPDWATTYLNERFAQPEQGAYAVIGWAIVNALVMLITSAALEAAVTLIAQDRPRPHMIVLGLSVVALSLVTGLGVMAGFVLLVIPGVILSLAWYVAVPAMVTERLGVIAAIKRSSHLTRNARGAIFGLSLAVGVAGLIVGWLAQLTASALNNPMATGIVSAAVQALVGAVTATLALTVYQELRQTREGTAEEALAAVFA